MKLPSRTLESIILGRIVPISERDPCIHVFDNYEQAILYTYNALSADELAQVVKRIGELPAEGKKEIDLNIVAIKKKAAELCFSSAEEHIQHFREEKKQRIASIKKAIAQSPPPFPEI